MVTCYLDTSALLKQYVDEAGSDWLRCALFTSKYKAVDNPNEHS